MKIDVHGAPVKKTSKKGEAVTISGKLSGATVPGPTL
jgi:hypothetical protein